MKRVLLEGEQKKPGWKYFHDAIDDAQRKQWLTKPFRNVPENLLPAIKASFLCYAQGIRKELLELLDKRTVQASEREEPLLANYLKGMNEFIAEAKANPEQDYL